MVHDSSVMKGALGLALAIAAGLPSTASAAPTDRADITGLADLAFGQLTMASDQTLSENVCAFSNSATTAYAVQATGDGTGSAFTLSNGSATLPYEVRWADSPGQTNGTTLTTGATVTGFASGGAQKTCQGSPASSATLLVTIRAAAAGSAQVGSYSGVLTLMLTPQ